MSRICIVSTTLQPGRSLDYPWSLWSSDQDRRSHLSTPLLLALCNGALSIGCSLKDQLNDRAQPAVSDWFQDRVISLAAQPSPGFAPTCSSGGRSALHGVGTSPTYGNHALKRSSLTASLEQLAVNSNKQRQLICDVSIIPQVVVHKPMGIPHLQKEAS